MYDYVWLCMAMFDYVELCMTMYGYVWICMAMSGYALLYMTMYDSIWLFMTLYDCELKFCQNVFCNSWDIADMYKCRQGMCCLSKCNHGIGWIWWNEPTFNVWSKSGQ